MVLTGFPNHPAGKIHPEYRRRFRRLFMLEKVSGADVVRTWLVPLPNRKSWERMLNYSSFAVSAFLRGIFLRKPDVVIGTSPQLLVGAAGLAVARFKRAPFIFEVRDLWPESLAAVGVSARNSLLMKLLGFIAGSLYKRSDHIVVVTPAFKNYLIEEWKVPAAKISVVMNGVDLDLFADTAWPESTSEHKGRPFIVSWIGTMGNAHGLEVVAEVASQLRDSHPRIRFQVVGDGAERPRFEHLVSSMQLTNVDFLGPKPRAEIPVLIGKSDVCLVLLKKSKVFETVVPTKMLEFMASGRPVILGVEGQARHIMQEANAEMFVQPEDAESLREAILQLYASPALRKQLGDNGKRYVTEKLSRESTAKTYIEVLRRVANVI